jgi:hypothetical protein
MESSFFMLVYEVVNQFLCEFLFFCIAVIQDQPFHLTVAVCLVQITVQKGGKKG